MLFRSCCFHRYGRHRCPYGSFTTSGRLSRFRVSAHDFAQNTAVSTVTGVTGARTGVSRLPADFPVFVFRHAYGDQNTAVSTVTGVTGARTGVSRLPADFPVFAFRHAYGDQNTAVFTVTGVRTGVSRLPADFPVFVFRHSTVTRIRLFSPLRA